MNAIELKNVTVSYTPLNRVSVAQSIFHRKKKSRYIAVNNVSLSVRRGEIIGIIGKNGSGKSTLLKAIANIFSADSGEINTFGQTVGLLSIGAGFNPEMSGRTNIYIAGLLLGLTKERISEKEKEIIDFSELEDFIDMPVKTYSSGMYSKLAFAITVCIQTDILLIDEVLSVGDEAFKRKSFGKLTELISDEGKTVVIVSHDLNTISGICGRAVWMDHGIIKEIGESSLIIKHYRDFVYGRTVKEEQTV